MRRARGQLKGPFALAGVVVLAACGRSADAVPAPSASSQAPAVPAAAVPAAPVPPQGASRPVTEAACATAPLVARVVAVRRESVDSVRVELTLANVTPAAEWRPGSPAATSVQAAVAALEGLSLLSADGLRRMFPLHGGTGQRLGSPVPSPAPGRAETLRPVFRVAC